MTIWPVFDWERGKITSLVVPPVHHFLTGPAIAMVREMVVMDVSYPSSRIAFAATSEEVLSFPPQAVP